ncbi:rod shape-determining protein MreD [Hazenella coriacea]|nr:rod shape-determining protein MreD [Hazenella coriacea]
MHFIFVGFLFFLFILEGSLLQLMLPQSMGSSYVVVSQLVFNGMILLSLYLQKREVFFYSLGFGLFYDLIYGPAIGIYTFTTIWTAFGVCWVAKRFPPVPWVITLTTLLAQWIHLSLYYGWLRLFDLTNQSLFPTLFNSIIPSVFFNLIMMYPIYLFIHWILYKYQHKSVQLYRT